MKRFLDSSTSQLGVFACLHDIPSRPRIGTTSLDIGVFDGCELFFRPDCVANLVPSWIPALEGVEAKLRGRREGRRSHVVRGGIGYDRATTVDCLHDMVDRSARPGTSAVRWPRTAPS